MGDSLFFFFFSRLFLLCMGTASSPPSIGRWDQFLAFFGQKLTLSLLFMYILSSISRINGSFARTRVESLFWSLLVTFLLSFHGSLLGLQGKNHHLCAHIQGEEDNLFLQKILDLVYPVFKIFLAICKMGFATPISSLRMLEYWFGLPSGIQVSPGLALPLAKLYLLLMRHRCTRVLVALFSLVTVVFFFFFLLMYLTRTRFIGRIYIYCKNLALFLINYPL